MTHLRLALLALALTLSATAAFAQPTGIVVFPPGPTNETPITIGIITTCAREDRYTVQKRGNEILLVIKAVNSCPSPPIASLADYVPIGTLPAGTYRVAYIFEGGDDIVRRIGTIHVRNAHSPVPFEIRPFAVRTNPAGLRLRVEPTGDYEICEAADCSDTTIRVDGVVVTGVRREQDFSVTFDAPPHAAGLVDVVIEKRSPQLTWTYPAALYYFDSPDLFAFERILFPVLFNAPGANGSRWLSEAAISNPNPFFVENYNSIDGIVCVTYPCGERLSPESFTRIVDGHYPRGVALLVPRPEADRLSFSLRVRDESRQAEGFGTEVPVVRERDLITDRPIELLDVPLDPRYRVKVRIYAFDPIFHNNLGWITLTDTETRAITWEQEVRLTRDCTGCPTTPLYAEIDLRPGRRNERVVISIQGPRGAPSWAFATVTNNDTQQVTVVSPQ